MMKMMENKNMGSEVGRTKRVMFLVMCVLKLVDRWRVSG